MGGNTVMVIMTLLKKMNGKNIHSLIKTHLVLTYDWQKFLCKYCKHSILWHYPVLRPDVFIYQSIKSGAGI